MTLVDPSDAWPPAAFTSALLDWFDRHGRHDLPWQCPATPYRVWVSEIMLQQTQVRVVIPYFARFMARFPTVASLAEAPCDAVLAQWAGLGYYARARHLHAASVLIHDRYGGIVPDDFATVAALPGVGRSTAGAILSLALDRPYPILDGNVRRVLARAFAIPGWPGQAPVLNRLWALAETLLPRVRPGAYNQALMDLGATCCTRAAPDCPCCPLAAHCLARRQGRQDALPAPRPRPVIPERATLMLAVRDPAGALLLERRPPAGIWGGLWSLPEASPDTDPADWCRARFGVAPRRVVLLPPRRHGFSHFRLLIRAVLLELDGWPRTVGDRAGTDCCWRGPDDDAADLGLPAPVKSLRAALPRWQSDG